MFTILSITSRSTVYFAIEHGGVHERVDTQRVGVDLNGDGTSDAYRPKNLDTLRAQAQNARQNSLERAIVKEKVAQSDVWPPETHAALERQSPTSHQIIAEKNRNTSEILAHLYTRLIDNFQKHGFSQVDATNSAADFMRKYSEQLQQLLAVNTEPTVMREKIRDYLREYRLSIGAPERTAQEGTIPEGVTRDYREGQSEGTRGTVVSPQLLEDDLFSENDHEFEEKMISYSESVLIIRKYEEEHRVSPEEVVREKLSENHLRTLVIPENDRENVLASAQIDSPASIVSGVGIGDSAKIQMLDENGISDVMCTHTQDGDYILHFPTGESILINANGDIEIAKKEIEFIQEIAKTPIVRRLLMSGNGKFQEFRRNFEKQFPGMDIEKNPQLFIKKVLERILSKIPEEGLTNLQKILKDHLASMISPDVSLNRIQEFLRNMRDQFIPMLHSSQLIPRDGMQLLNLQRLL